MQICVKIYICISLYIPSDLIRKTAALESFYNIATYSVQCRFNCSYQEIEFQSKIR